MQSCILCDVLNTINLIYGKFLDINKKLLEIFRHFYYILVFSDDNRFDSLPETNPQIVQIQPSFFPPSD